MGQDAATNALDEIAAICGCPEWEYPGQVVRDVSAMRGALIQVVAFAKAGGFDLSLCPACEREERKESIAKALKDFIGSTLDGVTMKEEG